MAVVLRTIRPSHPYNTGTELVRFSPIRGMRVGGWRVSVKLLCKQSGLLSTEGDRHVLAASTRRKIRGDEGGGGGGAFLSCMAVVVQCDRRDPRIPAMPGRSTSGFHRPGSIAYTKGRGRETSGRLFVNAYHEKPKSYQNRRGGGTRKRRQRRCNV